ADFLVAKRSGGVFYLRMEDTDKKREVEDGVSGLVNGLQAFGVVPDEGVTGLGSERGDYGPYTQSRRKEIYHSFARDLILRGYAYPCFCTANELEDLRAAQELAGKNKGYYGRWARCRNLSAQEQLRRIAAGEPFTLRLRSPGDPAKKIVVNDLVRGKLELPEYDMDTVLLKADGIPTYHFAHAVDDHLMRTTHVIRGEEWLASLPLHVQLFALLGFAPPQYAHTAAVMKLDPETGGKRKLSKRKDPEAAVRYFAEQGYPAEAVKEYLLTLLNSNFEDWRRANPSSALTDFPFSLKKLRASGCLFDLQKLEDVSKTFLSRMRAEDVFEEALAWATQHDPAWAALLLCDKDYATAFFAIGRGGAKPRKDFARWNQTKEAFAFFYDELFVPARPKQPDAAAIIDAFLRREEPLEDFARIKAICEPLGYCANTKQYKADPAAYKGSVSDVSTVIRLAVTGRENSPELGACISVLGAARVLERLKGAV
ncbi:MAG: glutamate--tRNA ligase, partial [Oscillospiraceae bacterium]|nr:glutamate--tRNA ligase [Oscillospiraceae bacterium]